MARSLDINQRMSPLTNRPPPLIPHGMLIFSLSPVKKKKMQKVATFFSLMLHNSKRWAFPCPADEVGSESLKPFEGPCRAAALQLCLGKPARVYLCSRQAEGHTHTHTHGDWTHDTDMRLNY